MGWWHGANRWVAVAVTCAVALLSASRSPVEAGSASLPQSAGNVRSAIAAGSGCTVRKVVRTWPVGRVARQTLVVPVDENHVGDVSRQVAAGVGGVILFGSSAPTDLATDLSTLLRQAPHGIPPVVMADEEGGAVQRMANLVGFMASPRFLAAHTTTAHVRKVAHRVGVLMHDAHVTMNLAPVLDLDDQPGPSSTNPDGTRSYSIHADVASAYGLAFARGMRAAGVVPVVKHFPGLGHATTNPDIAPASTEPWSVLKAAGLQPFKDAIKAGLPAVMVTTARVPGLTKLPATLSRAAVHGVLRGQLNFHGLVVTDSLSAGAISGAGFNVRRAAVQSLAVGADMLLFNATPGDVSRVTRNVVRSIVDAVGAGDLGIRRLRTAAVHVLKAKQAPVCG